VEREEAEQTLTHPDEILPGEQLRMIYQRVYFDKMLGQDMLVRLVVEEGKKEQAIVTIYKSSRLHKYRR